MHRSWILALLLALVPHAAAATETVYQLEAISGEANSRHVFPHGISDSGIVIGSMATPGGERPWVWHRDIGFRVLPAGPNGTRLLTARAVNERGVIVGGGRTAAPFAPEHAYRRGPDSGLRDLGDLGDGRTFSRARDINRDGTVVGTAWSPAAGAQRAFVWREDTGMRLLPTPDDPAVDTGATGINADGTVLAHAGPGGARRAFLWSPAAGVRWIPRLRRTDTDTVARAINDRGTVAGRSGGNGRYEGFIRAPGEAPRGLGRLDEARGYSAARDLNDHGVVVGRSLAADGMRAVVRYPGGSFQPLGKRLTDTEVPEALRLISAEGVNDAGWIVAYGRLGEDGAIKAFLLRPAPRPAVTPPALPLIGRRRGPLCSPRSGSAP